MITVLHNPTFTDAFWDGDCAKYLKPVDTETLVTVAEVDTDNLEIAFGLTNHIHQAWQENEGVTPLGEAVSGARSTSQGDVMILNGVMFVVGPFGFITLDTYREKYHAGK